MKPNSILIKYSSINLDRETTSFARVSDENRRNEEDVFEADEDLYHDYVNAKAEF